MAAPKFTVTGTLVDFGGDPRPGIKVKAVATPGTKIDGELVHSNVEGEATETGEDGSFTLDLVSIPGLWYLIGSSPRGAMNAVRLAAYTLDPEDPSTGVAFDDGHTIALVDIMDEQPTPGYEAVLVGGVVDHGALEGLEDDDHPQYLLRSEMDNLATDAEVLAAVGLEASVREAGDADLQEQIDNLPGPPDLSPYATVAALAAEQEAREDGDGINDAAIDAETAERIAADDALADDIAAEAATRGAADTALDGRLDDLEALDVIVEGDPRLTNPRTPTTHTHPTSQVDDLAEFIRDTVGALLVGSGITISVDDAGDTITLTGVAGADAEQVRDIIGVALIGVGLISVTVDDSGDTILISTSATQNSTDAALRDRSTHTGFQTSTSISDLAEAVQDIVGAFIGAGTGISVSYNDAGNAFTISLGAHTHATSDITSLAEFVRDTVAAFVVGGTNMTVTHDDAGDTLTLASSGGSGGGSSTPPGVKAVRTAALTVTAAGFNVPWDTEEWDTHGFHSTSTNPEQFVVPAGMAGRYRLSYAMGITDNADFRFIMGITKNGVAIKGTNYDKVMTTNDAAGATVSTEIDVAVGDVIRTTCYITGASRNADTTRMAFSMTKVDVYPAALAPSPWQSWTPTLKGSVSNPNLGSTGTAKGRYRMVGDRIELAVEFKFGGTGVTSGSGIFSITLPPGITLSNAVADFVVGGAGYVYDDSSGNVWPCTAARHTDTELRLYVRDGGVVQSGQPNGGWGANDAVALHFSGEVSAGGVSTGAMALSRDLRWFCPSSWMSIDEFNDDTLGPDWSKVYPGLTSAVVWTEFADSLSANVANGGAQQNLQSIVRPLTSAGGPMAVGDAFITALTVFTQNGQNYTMGGIVLADGATAGAGNQLVGLAYNGTPNGIPANVTIWSGVNYNAITNLTADTTGQVAALWYLRLVRLSSTTWRFDISPDGISWLLGSVATKSGFTPTHVGLSALSFGTNYKGVASYEFLRRVSGIS